MQLSTQTWRTTPPKYSKACWWQDRKCSSVSASVNSRYSLRLKASTMRKKDSRRRVEPTGTEPAQPQSTWAHCPGSKCSVRKAGRGLGRTWRTKALEDRVAALVTALLEPLENLLGRVIVLFQQTERSRP